MLELFNIDIVLVLSFFITNILLGVISCRSIRSMSEYALGGRRFNTTTLTATVVATMIGGFTLNNDVSLISLHGILGIFHVIFRIFMFLVMGYLLSLKIEEFVGKLSAPEVVGSIYGTHMRIITAILSLITMIMVIAMQIKVFSIIFNHFLNIDGDYAMIISTIIIIIYSAFGGIRAVTLTDVFQFYTLGAFVPLLTILVWNRCGTWKSILNTITTSPQFSIEFIINNCYSVKNIWVVLFLCGTAVLNPAIFHKVLMGRNAQQIQKVFILSTLSQLLFFLFMLIIVLALTSSGINITNTSFLQIIVDQYAYPGFKGVIVIGVAAMIMSTADSSINSSAVICVNDLLNVLGLVKKDNHESNIKAARISSILVGTLALIIALWKDTIYNIGFILMFAHIPMLFILLMITLGFRTTPRTILSGLITNILVMLIMLITYNNSTPIPHALGLLANTIVVMGMHYILNEPGGWTFGSKSTKMIQKQ